MLSVLQALKKLKTDPLVGEGQYEIAAGPDQGVAHLKQILVLVRRAEVRLGQSFK